MEDILLFVSCALLIQIFILFMHYRQHFKLQLCKLKTPNCSSNRLPQSTSKIATVKSASDDEIIKTLEKLESIQNKRKIKCHCKLISIDDQEFDFLPISFCGYTIFIILLYIFLIVNIIIINSNHTMYATCNNVIYFGVMILCIWESVFAWYRYYTTKISAAKFNKSISIEKLISKFLLYAFVFILLCIANLYIFDYIYPILILLHASSNIYCNHKSTSILIKRYRTFLKVNESFGNTFNKHYDESILKAIFLMRKVSLISNIISIISLSIFLYKTDAIYYICILWNISCFIFSINFIRNRSFLKKCFYYIYCRYNHTKIEPKQTNNNAPIQLNENPSSPISATSPQSTDININSSSNDLQNKQNYDRFNQLIEVINDEIQDSNMIENDNKIIALNTSQSDCRYVNIPKNIKPKYRSNPITTELLLHTSNNPNFQTNTESKQDTEITYEDSEYDHYEIMDEYDENDISTPLPMMVDFDSEITVNHIGVNTLLSQQLITQSNPVNVNDQKIRSLINNKSAPHPIISESDHTYMDKEEQLMELKNDIETPTMNLYTVSNNVMGKIKNIKNILGFGHSNLGNEDYLIENNMSENLDELVMQSLDILAKHGLYSVQPMKKTDKNSVDIKNQKHGNTPRSAQINVDTFLKPPIAFVQKNSV
eukprot:128459_1